MLQIEGATDMLDQLSIQFMLIPTRCIGDLEVNIERVMNYLIRETISHVISSS